MSVDSSKEGQEHVHKRDKAIVWRPAGAYALHVWTCEGCGALGLNEMVGPYEPRWFIPESAAHNAEARIRELEAAKRFNFLPLEGGDCCIFCGRPGGGVNYNVGKLGFQRVCLGNLQDAGHYGEGSCAMQVWNNPLWGEAISEAATWAYYRRAELSSPSTGEKAAEA